MTPSLIEIALKEYGKSDFSGASSNPEIVKYFHEIGASWVANDDTAWCAAFVQWVLKQAKKQYSSALNARSFLKYGIPVLNPEVGDIVIFWRIAENSVYGHVAFFIREDVNNVWVLGGNQGDRVCIAAYPKARLLGYRHVTI